ncbi:MAG: glycosyltransferase family 39 protein [Candidatus Omnitrophica bacterium]|nr:glycosyltransferase family 39 protein [Candidatus Omnitrophota bacterium]
MEKIVMGNKTKQIIILIFLAYIFLMFGNGLLSLTNPDEVFYTQTAREMIQHKTWMTPILFGQPQFEKPIFIYWLIRVSFSIFGNTSFAARFGPAFIAILGIIATYLLALLGFKDNKKAFFVSFILMSSGLYIGLARTVFTDMIFSVFILFALLAFYWGYTCKARKGLGLILFFVSSALAVLSKGPLGILIPFSIILVFLFIKKDLKFVISKYSLLGLIAFAAIALPWYILMEVKYGSVFNREFFYNDHFVRIIRAEHRDNDTWYFYPLTALGAVFPWTIYTCIALVCLFINIGRRMKDFNLFLLLWVSSVFLTFQFAHSKLTSYVFPFFPALAIMTGDYIYDQVLAKKQSRVFFVASIIMAVVLFIFPIAIPIAGISILKDYPIFIEPGPLVYFSFSLLILMAVLFLVFILRRKFMKAFYLLSLPVLVLIFSAGFMHEKIEPYVSSRDAANYLMNNYKVEGPIICSKFYARGVRFYTDKEVVAVDIPGSQFFSPHPILFLDTHQKVRDFLSKRPINYGILKKNNVRDFEGLTEKHYKFEVLKQCGNEYVVRISPLP